MTWRRFLVLAGVSSTLVACGALIGILDIGVDPAPLAHDAGGHFDGAEPVDAPAPEDSAPDVDLPPPVIVDSSTPARRVFLTSTTTRGAIGGLAGADTLCRSAASGLGGTWVAWVSGEGKNAYDRLDFPGPYITVTHALVVLHKTDLQTAPLEHLINIMENGTQLMSDKPWVWTGTLRNGTASYDCNNWTNGSGAAAGIAGSFDQVSNGKWTQNDGEAPFVATFNCGTLAHLYCFELN